MKKNLLVWCLLMMGSSFLFAQENFPINGVRDKRDNAFAFVHASIYTDYKTKIENATLLIKNGEVESVNQTGNVPIGYTEIDCTDKTIYPSFIDLNTNYGLPAVPKSKANPFSGAEVIEPIKDGAYNANDAINSATKTSEMFKINDKTASSYRKIGFGAVLSTYADGIARGTSTLVTLNDGRANEAMVFPEAAATYSFSKGSSGQSFPVSTMGSVALLRQTFMDAKWYETSQPFTDLTLDSWIKNQDLVQIFYAGNKYGVMRADKIGDEFGVQYIINTSGDEYQRVDEVMKTNAPLIVPVNFPAAYDVDDPYAALDVTLAQMKHWELAPSNLGLLTKKGIKVAITSNGLKQKDDFLKNVRKAIDAGLSEQNALKALTHTPASLVNAGEKLGSLKKGKFANFIITSGNVFKEDTKIYENWIQGNKFEITAPEKEIREGSYLLSVDTATYNVEIKDKKFKIIINDSTSVKINSKIEDNVISLNFETEESEGLIRLSGWKVDEGWNGQGQLENGKWVDWSIKFSVDFEEIKEEESEEREPEAKDSTEKNLGEVIYPFVAYGQTALPQVQTLLIRNATIWTNENDGILENSDVLLQDGKIKKIGKNIDVGGAIEIDGTGKHLTAGIIDEHSHIASFSTNDVAVNSSMVRMKDVVNPEDIKIYQQLAGGVTASQLLHGSANPIGGQSAIIKLKWGESSENMIINDADEFIKFALGENVKRSRNTASIRYPQTRMGVEQVYVDAFTNALEYQRAWKKYNGLSSKERSKILAPRQDLVQDAMLEIINKQRFITCHSYVQSEINMLMKVAEKFNFNVNTFTHILEGYKVADKMREHGVGASTFSDWWAYKWEVRYAIPYNASLMNNEGVIVAINSDDGEMGRRLNQEAAKSIKYGNMSEEDALKMVTLNPAKLLHLDHRMGSIKVGKDADVVLWNDHPLSVYAKPLKTVIDGVIYFDAEQDLMLREKIAIERARLTQRMKEEKSAGKSIQQPEAKAPKNYHCDDIVFQN